MTSSVMSIWACAMRSAGASARNGLSVPKASEWRTTSIPARVPSASRILPISAIVSARLSSSAALMLKKTGRTPQAAISAVIRSTFGCVALRSRWTPKTFRPARARARDVPSPNPDEAPRTRAQERFAMGRNASRRLVILPRGTRRAQPARQGFPRPPPRRAAARPRRGARDRPSRARRGASGAALERPGHPRCARARRGDPPGERGSGGGGPHDRELPAAWEEFKRIFLLPLAGRAHRPGRKGNSAGSEWKRREDFFERWRGGAAGPPGRSRPKAALSTF